MHLGLVWPGLCPQASPVHQCIRTSGMAAFRSYWRWVTSDRFTPPQRSVFRQAAAAPDPDQSGTPVMFCLVGVQRALEQLPSPSTQGVLGTDGNTCGRLMVPGTLLSTHKHDSV